MVINKNELGEWEARGDIRLHMVGSSRVIPVSVNAVGQTSHEALDNWIEEVKKKFGEV